MENNENNSLLSSLQVEDDEHESKESVLQRYFLQEWKLVKSLLDDIVLNRGSCDLSSVHKIRSIVRLFFTSTAREALCFSLCFGTCTSIFLFPWMNFV